MTAGFSNRQTLSSSHLSVGSDPISSTANRHEEDYFDGGDVVILFSVFTLDIVLNLSLIIIAP